MKLEMEETNFFDEHVDDSDAKSTSRGGKLGDVELKIIGKDEVIGKEVFFDNQINKRSGRIGNTWVYMYNKEGVPKIVIGPHCNSYPNI
jgi:hypothetical protein